MPGERPQFGTAALAAIEFRADGPLPPPAHSGAGEQVGQVRRSGGQAPMSSWPVAPATGTGPAAGYRADAAVAVLDAAGTEMSISEVLASRPPRRWLVQSLARSDGGGHVAEYLACFWLIWPGDGAERLQQVPPGPPQQTLAARGGLARTGRRGSRRRRPRRYWLRGLAATRERARRPRRS